jgi:hypothetical protein
VVDPLLGEGAENNVGTRRGTGDHQERLVWHAGVPFVAGDNE